MIIRRTKKLWPVLVMAVAVGGAACGGGEEEMVATCTDGIMNGDETDVDCGGSCDGCLDGQACILGDDCLSGWCDEGVCVTPTCEDEIKNGNETDVDCGGPECPPCGAGESCVLDGDCASELCEEGVCVTPDSCADGILNGDETDVDCGGSCQPCEVGKLCQENSDCESDYCSSGMCENPPSCNDEVKNGEETDIDCGGPDCPPCPESFLCQQNSDCVMEVCADGICNSVEDHCNNGVMDGDETDIDCGGSCPPCDTGFGCETHHDCLQGFMPINCDDGVCGGLMHCTNGQMDGRETDVDCGGPFCPGCLGGKSCLIDSDCASGECDGGACTEPEYTCDNGVVDGHETDVDCGGPVCPGCESGMMCENETDCEMGDCDDGFCDRSVACQDEIRNGHETDVDCGGPLCPPCGAGRRCLEDGDCASGECVDGLCAVASTCGDGEQNGGETDIDCGGPLCTPCLVGKSCEVNSDCITNYCQDGTCAYSIRYIQSGDASVNCATSGRVTIIEGVTISPVIVVSDAFAIDESTDGYYVAADSSVFWSPEYRGILVAVDASLGVSIGPGDAVSVTGDYVEDDCMSTIVVGPSGGITGTADDLWMPWGVLMDENGLEQGGGPDVQPYESMLVRIRVTVTDVTGFDGPEGPGEPRWWFKVGDGIFVANDFGLTNLPEMGTRLELVGVLKYRQGVYLVVPLKEDHIKEDGGGIVPID